MTYLRYFQIEAFVLGQVRWALRFRVKTPTVIRDVALQKKCSALGEVQYVWDSVSGSVRRSQALALEGLGGPVAMARTELIRRQLPIKASARLAIQDFSQRSLPLLW